MPNRKPRNLVKRQVYLSVLLVLAVSLAFSTQVEVGPNPGSPTGVNPIISTGTNSGNSIVALNFTIEDGGDTIINKSVDPGDALYSFEDGGTMFLNQSDDSTKGENGFNAGEDIFNVSLLHNASAGSFSGEVVGNFSNDTLYADGGNYSNSKFDGRGNKTPELVVRDNGSHDRWLDSQDFAVVNGSLNASNFSEEVVYADVNDNGYFDNGTDVIVRNNSASDNLEDADTVLRPGKSLSYFGGNNYWVAFPDWDDSNEYQEGRALVKKTDSWNNQLERDDEVIMEGEANLVDVSTVNLSFHPNNTGNEFDTDQEPIYHTGASEEYVNASQDTRLGEVEVYSGEDDNATTVDLGLETMSYIDSSGSPPETNEIGKNLYDVSVQNDYPGEGSFWVYELSDGSPADETLNPGSGDQEILVYDLDSGDQISPGETLLYNSDPDNNNVSIDVGEEFKTIEDIPEVDKNYSVSAEIGYMDNGSGSFELSADNISVNISYGTNWEIVNLAPNEYNNTLGGSGTFVANNAEMRFWNSSETLRDTSDFIADGLFVDTDNSGDVSHGDVRIGEWTYQHEPGAVKTSDMDVGAGLSRFYGGKAAIIDADDDGNYDPGSGSASSGREAIITVNENNPPLLLEDFDYIIREGEAGFSKMNETSPETLYFDHHNSGYFQSEQAIIKNTGDDPRVLEDADTVVKSGLATLTPFNNSELYVENGTEPGFEKGSMEAIIYDNNSDGVLTRGPLDSRDHVISAGYANLQRFELPPREENNSGFLFVDRNMNAEFSAGEDILNVTLVTNGSDSEKINGSEIFNFADSTKHNGSENYTDGNAIVNDTDGNEVYQDVLESLEVSNTENMNYSHIMDGVIELFRDEDGNRVFSRSDDQKIVDLTQDSSKTWSADMNQNITSDTTFFLTFNSSEEIPYEGVFDMKARLSSIGLAGDESFPNKESSQIQRIDNYPPKLKTAWTGFETGGNNTERNRMKVVFDGEGSFLQQSSINGDDEEDFEVLADDISVENERLGKGKGFLVVLELNKSIETNRTPRINITGTITDGAGNVVDLGSKTDSRDGLKPNITRVTYQDENADGQIDELDVFFSENVSYDSFEAGDWAVTDNNISSFSVSDGTVSDSYMLELDASAEDGVTGVEENEPELNFTQQGNTVYDSNGNSLSTVKNVTIEDDAGPAITSAETIDPDFDAEVEEIKLNFSENISDQDSTINTSAFNLSDGEIISADSVDANDSQLKLEVRDLETSSTPEVTMFRGYLYDFHNNTAADNQTFTATEDGARPVLLHATLSSLSSNSTQSIVSLKFSEPVKDSSPGNGEGVVLSEKNLEPLNTSLDATHYLNYSETLRTGQMPNITSADGLMDDEGNEVALKDGGNVTVSTFRHQIRKGWNMVSLPIADQSDPLINETLNESKIHIVWRYIDGKWESYDPGAPSNDFDSFQGGVGYLINASEGFTLNPNVNAVWRGENKDDIGFDRASAPINDGGWSLIGHFQEYAQIADGVSYVNSSKEVEVVSDPSTVKAEDMWKAPALGEPRNGGNIGPVYGPDFDLIVNPDTIADLDTRKIKSAQGVADFYMFPGTAYWVKIDDVESWTWNSVNK